MTKQIEHKAQESEAAATHGPEDGTDTLKALSDMALSEVKETPEEIVDAGATGEAGTATDGNPAADGEHEETDAEKAGETGTDGERVTFTPEQQKVFDSRLGREVAKRKTEHEKAEALTTKVTTLEGELTALKSAAEGNVPLHPEWVPAADLAAIAEAGRLETEAQRLKRNWQGVENEDPAKAMTAEQVQQEYARVTAELAALRPKADAAWKSGQAQFVADAKLGRKIREDRAKAAELAKSGKTDGEGRTAATVVPAGQGAAGRTPISTPTKRGQSGERFDKAGGTREAAEKELAELVGG